MVITELKTKDEILNIVSSHWHADNDAVLSPMFHGTDASMLYIMPQEREQIEVACGVIITALVQLYKDNSLGITDKRLMSSCDERSNSGDALVKAQGRVNKSRFYNYDYFCVTNHPLRAIDYSKQSWICGESGWVANRLLETAKDLDLVLPDDDQFNQSLCLLNNRKRLRDDPLVLVLVDVDSFGVCLEDGTQLKRDSDADKHAFKISDVKCHDDVFSLRIEKDFLENIENLYAVRKSNYDELINAWESLRAN